MAFNCHGPSSLGAGPEHLLLGHTDLLMPQDSASDAV